MIYVHFSCFTSADLANPQSEEMIGEVVVPPARKLEDLIRLAELCVDLLRQNEEFYAEVTVNNFINQSPINVVSCQQMGGLGFPH